MAIERLRRLSLRRRHPRSELFSRYLDGDLDASERRTLEDHMHGCPRCQRELDSLGSTVHALGSLEPGRPPDLANSIVAALHAEEPSGLLTGGAEPHATGSPALRVVPNAAIPRAGGRVRNRWPHQTLAALRWCVARSQLRLTLPISVLAGVVLSMVNMGGMLMHGRIDLGVCISCTVDFLVPFIVLNIGLLMLLRLPGRGRVGARWPPVRG